MNAVSVVRVVGIDESDPVGQPEDDQLVPCRRGFPL